MTIVLQSFVVAFKALLANKMRSALTMLGIIIGVGAVISLMSVGKGLQEGVVNRIQATGTNLLYVRPAAVQEPGRVRGGVGDSPRLTLEDSDAIKKSGLPSIALVAPERRAVFQVIGGSLNMRAQVVGVTPEYLTARAYELEGGDFIDEQHITSRSMVAVLGSNVVQTLFSGDDVVGQSVKINNKRFTVIGVLKSKGSSGMTFLDDVVFIPLTTMQFRLLSQRTGQNLTIQQISIQVSERSLMDPAREEVAQILRERHRITGEDDFLVNSQEDLLKAMSEVTQVFTIFLGAIAAISLLVGGIGIMNIMLVSVTERTREIGIRKAVGAKRRHILAQFIVEATTLSFIGGALGFVLGLVGSRMLSGINLSGQAIQTVVSADIVILAIVVAISIGLFFGIYPATRAARLDPIQALRTE